MGSTEEIQFEHLPHDCLSMIFSPLSMKEAVRTSVVSTGWRYLWTYGLPRNLEFDACFTILRETNYTSEMKTKRRADEKVEFVRRVDKFIQSLHFGEIDKFRLQFDLGAKAAVELDRWVSFAIDRRVKEIDINLKQIDHRIKDVKKYDFPLSVLDETKKTESLRSLCLASCIFRVYPEFNGLSALEFLTLDNVEISQTQLECLIPKCRHLQRLRLMYINGVEELDIDGSSLPLKYMEVKSCHQLRKIEIKKAAELTTFEYTGKVMRLFFKDTPQLINMTIIYKPDHVQDGHCYGLFDVFQNIKPRRQLETFILSTTANHFQNLPYPLAFRKLKKLVIIANASKRPYLLWVLFLLMASPLLEKFEMHLTSSSSEEGKQPRVPERFRHDHLKEMTITGVRGYECEVSLVHSLLATCTCPLKLLTIDPREWVYCGDGQWNLPNPSESWAISKQQWFRDELLKRFVYFNTKLVIL